MYISDAIQLLHGPAQKRKQFDSTYLELLERLVDCLPALPDITGLIIVLIVQSSLQLLVKLLHNGDKASIRRSDYFQTQLQS